MTDQSQPNSVKGDRLLYVHGRDFKPTADQLLEFNVSTLDTAISRDRPDAVARFRALDKKLCYYGDMTNEFLLARGGHYDESLDMGDRRNALLKLKSLVKTKHFGVTRYDRLPGKTAVAEFAADVAAPLLGSIGLSKALISRVAPDLAEYWKADGDFAARLRARVRQPIIEALDREERLLLVAHGTGSIIAYDVLWQLSHDPEYAGRYAERKIDTLLTLGSPLGDSMVRRRLLGAKSKGRMRYPINVMTWYNVSAEDDYLCHDNTLADDYKVMLKQRQVSSIRDYRIYNLSVRYGKSNPHSSVGYLIHPRTAQIVADWMESQLPATEPTGNP